VEGLCGRGEVEALAEVLLDVVLGHVALDDDSLGRSLFSNQQNTLHREGRYQMWCTPLMQ